MAKKEIDFSELDNFHRKLDDNDLTMIAYGDFEVGGDPKIRMDSLQNTCVWHLQFGKMPPELKVQMSSSGLITISWLGANQESQQRQIALGTEHDIHQVRAFFVESAGDLRIVAMTHAFQKMNIKIMVTQQ